MSCYEKWKLSEVITISIHQLSNSIWICDLSNLEASFVAVDTINKQGLDLLNRGFKLYNYLNLVWTEDMGCEHLGKELRIKHLGKVETIPLFHLLETNIF